MKRALMILVCFGILTNAIGQDLHFSQIYNSPLTLNPALTGLFTGDQRAVLNFKDQWRSIGKTFRTYAVSYDQGILKGDLRNGYIGLGGYLFSDKAGDLSMGNIRAQFDFSGIVEINRSQMLSGGFYIGYSQYSIDFSEAQWDSQYSGGSFSSSLPTNEPNINSDS